MTDTTETLKAHPQEIRVLRDLITKRDLATRELSVGFAAFLAARGYSGGTLREITADGTVVVAEVEAPA